MNWEAMGAIGEIAGAAGVILTLIYLATQIRQNTRASRIAAIQNATETSAKFTELLATDGELNEIFWRGLGDPDALHGTDFRRFTSAINTFLRRESVNYRLYKEGLLPKDDWEIRKANLSGILNMPGTKVYLDMAPYSLSTDFRIVLEEIMAEPSNMTEGARERMFDFDK